MSIQIHNSILFWLVTQSFLPSSQGRGGGNWGKKIASQAKRASVREPTVYLYSCLSSWTLYNLHYGVSNKSQNLFKRHKVRTKVITANHIVLQQTIINIDLGGIEYSGKWDSDFARYSKIT